MMNIRELEYLRGQADQRFDQVKNTWIDTGWWTAPHLTKWLLGKEFGRRNNQHITDTTHISARRSYVSGFLEGNTSATRPWFKQLHADPVMNRLPSVKKWLDHYNERLVKNLQASNFYNEAPKFYDQYGIFNSGTHYIVERPGSYFFYTLEPGSYKLLNDQFGVANIMFIERKLNVKALVDQYGVKNKSGVANWSNFSSRVKLAYERGNYGDIVDFIIAIMPNDKYNPMQPTGGKNRPWIIYHYECGSSFATGYVQNVVEGMYAGDSQDVKRFLKVDYAKRKPFIPGKSPSSGNFEYGEDGPSLQALGLIKSLNKKAIAKDKALEKIIDPAVQGPANLKKSYRTTMSNTYIPMDVTTLDKGGLRTVHDINPAIVSLAGDVEDMRQQVNKLYYADFLLYLTMNPKTRTAEETRAILAEQQMVIGPNLQSLNWTYNIPITDFNADWTLEMDPYLQPPPPELEGEFLRTEFISVFAQAQKAADLGSINQYVQSMINLYQQTQDGQVMQKVNLDKYADLLEDRLYLPEGLNRDQKQVDAMRQQAEAMAQRQQALTEMLPAVAGAIKDVTPQGG